MKKIRKKLKKLREKHGAGTYIMIYSDGSGMLSKSGSPFKYGSEIHEWETWDEFNQFLESY